MKPRMLLLPLVAFACFSSASPGAQVPVINEPGKPTIGRMVVVNQDRSEAIPVRVEGAGETLPVAARLARQAWEYRLLSVPPGDDPSSALNTFGGDGWELVTVSTAGARSLWTFKRPK